MKENKIILMMLIISLLCLLMTTVTLDNKLVKLNREYKILNIRYKDAVRERQQLNDIVKSIITHCDNLIYSEIK